MRELPPFRLAKLTIATLVLLAVGYAEFPAASASTPASSDVVESQSVTPSSQG